MTTPRTVPSTPGRGAVRSGRRVREGRVPYTPPIVPTPPATRKLSGGLFTLTFLVADSISLATSVFLTYWLRFTSGLLPSPLGVPDPLFYAGSLIVVLPVGIAVLHSAGLYRRHRLASPLRDLAKGARAALSIAVLLAAIAFFYRDFSYSRTFLAGFVPAFTALFVLGRTGASLVHRGLRARGVGLTRVGILGGGLMAARLTEKISRRKGSGLKVVAHHEGFARADDAPDAPERRPFPSGVRTFLRANRITRVIVTDARLTHDERLDLVELCHAEGARCEFVPDLFEVMSGRVEVEEIDGIPLVGSKLHPLSRLDRMKKRTLDLAASSALLLLLSPTLLLIAILVRLDSRGPIFYRQRRLGRDGREFDIVKFRSMSTSAEGETGPVRARRGDPRRTRLGRLLRRTSLDELPQLWNVLRGEMSLVGPRPERSFFVDRYQELIPRYLERHGVKSGLTGWAQVHGLRGDTSIEERTRYDIWYVENWSLGLDLKILGLTLIRFLLQEEAY